MSLAKIAEALNKAQSTMSGAKKDKKNPFFKSTYADLSAVFEAIKEPFAENGLSVTQTMDVLENGRMVIKTILLHNSGETIESKMILPDISDPQKIGSAITYFRRYSLMAIAGIPAEDDDGNTASQTVKRETQLKPMISDEEFNNLNELLNNNEKLKTNICLFLKQKHGLDNLRFIPRDLYNLALSRAQEQK